LSGGSGRYSSRRGRRRRRSRRGLFEQSHGLGYVVLRISHLAVVGEVPRQFAEHELISRDPLGGGDEDALKGHFAVAMASGVEFSQEAGKGRVGGLERLAEGERIVVSLKEGRVVLEELAFLQEQIPQSRRLRVGS
jgi:hypothetical protein